LPHGFTRRLASETIPSDQQFARFDQRLDQACFGPLWLNDPRIAESVLATLARGTAQLNQYSLLAYVVMANHVHLLIEPRTPLDVIMKGSKGTTARHANRILWCTGKTFWQDESFDHWTRDAAEEAKIRRYIENNPVKASLVARPQDWIWSSAK
jgi:REP-associated tyrosine transposase